jgi:transcriptional regulator with PAS, ATPase and Fis domain
MHFELIGLESKVWPPEIALEKWYERVHPEDLPKVEQSLVECVEGVKNKYSCEYRVRHENGDWIWVASSGVLVEKDEDGRGNRIVGSLANITEQKQSRLNLHAQLEMTIRETTSFHGIIGRSQAMQQVFETILQVTTSRANVIIYGESGTGKELVANVVHHLSDRRDKSFVAVNCGAIPDSILESEFFGYKKGAFTGANADKAGFLDTAHKGTLFLDELGELPLSMQAKLLRAVEGSGYTPVGGTDTKQSDFRIVAATNRDLKAMVDEGKMRGDFYYRVHVIPVQLPPLRDRKDDIPLLVYHFLEKFNADQNKHQTIPGEIVKAMVDYDWPGNIRELQNVINRYLTLGKIDFIGEETSVPEKEVVGVASFRDAVADLERRMIVDALTQTAGNKTKAAQILQLPRRTIIRKIDSYGIDIQSKVDIH